MENKWLKLNGAVREITEIAYTLSVRSQSKFVSSTIGHSRKSNLGHKIDHPNLPVRSRKQLPQVASPILSLIFFSSE